MLVKDVVSKEVIGNHPVGEKEAKRIFWLNESVSIYTETGYEIGSIESGIIVNTNSINWDYFYKDKEK